LANVRTRFAGRTQNSRRHFVRIRLPNGERRLFWLKRGISDTYADDLAAQMRQRVRENPEQYVVQPSRRAKTAPAAAGALTVAQYSARWFEDRAIAGSTHRQSARREDAQKGREVSKDPNPSHDHAPAQGDACGGRVIQHTHANKEVEHGLPPVEDLAAMLRDHAKRAGITRSELEDLELSPNEQPFPPLPDSMGGPASGPELPKISEAHVIAGVPNGIRTWFRCQGRRETPGDSRSVRAAPCPVRAA
jgi:hypothetical protein